MKRFFFAIWEVAEVVLIAAVTVFVVRSFLVQPFLVSGASMEPSFSDGDYLIVDEISYRFREPDRGETIVFRYPGNPSLYYIKRVIGLPGERVEIKDGGVTIYNQANPNGLRLDEKYIDSHIRTSGQIDTTLGLNDFFVLGDNRNYSFDSRLWGVLPRQNIIGIVRMRLLPLNQAQAFDYKY